MEGSTPHVAFSHVPTFRSGDGMEDAFAQEMRRRMEVVEISAEEEAVGEGSHYEEAAGRGAVDVDVDADAVEACAGVVFERVAERDGSSERCSCDKEGR